jgi:YD repeat-containing protein
VLNGAAVVQGSAYAYWDSVNLTYVGDEVVPANSSSIAYTPTNRLSWTSGAWGSGASFAYDGTGNRVYDYVTDTNVTRIAIYGTANNRLMSMTENGAALRSYTYDGAGNIITDMRPGETYGYTYNKRNRLASVTRNTVCD